MAADGQIVLGLNISETTSQISADLSTILNGLGTKQLILKAAIEKSQVEKGVASLVKEINQETAKIGIEVDPKSVSKVITQQQKMASMQKELVQQMEKYKQVASDVGLTLKGATQNSFKSAIDANDFKAAKESLRSVKKEIDEYNTAIKKMNEDTKLDFDIQNIQSKFSVLKNQTDSVKTLFKQLEQSQKNFNNATSNPQKLQYYNELKGVIGQLEVEYQALKQSESALAIDSGIKKQMQDMDTYVKNLKATYSTIGDSAGAEKLKNAIQELDTVLQNVDRNAVGGKLVTEWEAVTEKVNAAKRAVSEYRAEQSVISKKVDILDSISEKAGTMKLNIDTSGIAGSGITELSKRFDELSSRAKQLKSELQDLDPSNGEDVQRLTQEVRKLQDEFNNLSKSSNVFKDTTSIQKLKNYLIHKQMDDKAVVFPYALGDENKTVHFLETGSTSQQSESGGVEVQQKAFDLIENLEIYGDPMVKMDIEGGELSALKGMEIFIKERQPYLAICLYHKEADLFDIPNYIKNLCPDYRIYIRGGWHLECWAIPKRHDLKEC